MPDSNEASSFERLFEPGGISLNPEGTLLAVASDGIYSVPSGKRVHRIPAGSDSVLFGSDGLLWTCVIGGLVQIFEPKQWKSVARLEFEDPYGGSFVHLFPHTDDGSVVIWIAAGQDGQAIFWARHRKGKIDVEMFPELSDTAPRALNPWLEEFLVVSEGELQLYDYPRGPLKGRLVWPEEEEYGLAECVVYVDEDRAVVSSLDDRLFLIDVDKMRIIDPVTIATEAGIGWTYRLAPGRFVTVQGPERNHLAVWNVPPR